MLGSRETSVFGYFKGAAKKVGGARQPQGLSPACPSPEKENLSCGDRHSPERTLTGQRAGQREAERRSVRPQRSMVK